MNLSSRRKSVGAFLRAKRESAGLTQSDVSGELGYGTAQFVSNWERGISMPPMAALPKIAKLYKIEPKAMIKVFQQYEEANAAEKIKELQSLFKRRSKTSR